MCGLVGLFDQRGDRRFSDQLIRSMTAALAHRGPDGDGFWHEPGLAFGHQRLAIIDLAGGIQPMQTTDGKITVVLNGELYNFREVRAALEMRGHVFQTRSDTEVLLHGWREWKGEMAKRIRGQFAFAIWDSADRVLFLARDRLGEKPLHYAQLPDGTFAFASEIKALLAHPAMDRRLDQTAVADFLTFAYVPDPKSIYKTIHKLPPGHTLTVRRGQPLQLRRYWSLTEEAAKHEGSGVPSSEEMRSWLRKVVELELIADVKVGAFLSGGVDSSAVVAMMSQVSSSPVPAFTISFDEQAFDESEYATAVARKFGAEHQVFRVSGDSAHFVDSLSTLFDEPFGDPSAIPTYRVCAEASRHVKVCVSGDGGDEALAGYRRYRFHLAGSRVRSALPTQLREPLFGFMSRFYPKLDWAPQSLRAKTTLQELASTSEDAYFRMVSAISPELLSKLQSGDVQRELAGYDPSHLIRSCFAESGSSDHLQKAQYTDLMTYLPGDILTKVDRASMANSLEVRPPLLDSEFVGWCYALPSRAKITGSDGKVALKKAMEGLLPNDLLYRPKQGFSVPLAAWLRSQLRDRVRALPSSSRLSESGLVDSAMVGQLAAQHLSGRWDHSKPLWLLLCLESFLAKEGAARTPMPFVDAMHD